MLDADQVCVVVSYSGWILKSIAVFLLTSFSFLLPLLFVTNAFLFSPSHNACAHPPAGNTSHNAPACFGLLPLSAAISTGGGVFDGADSACHGDACRPGSPRG